MSEEFNEFMKEQEAMELDSLFANPDWKSNPNQR